MILPYKDVNLMRVWQRHKIYNQFAWFQMCHSHSVYVVFICVCIHIYIYIVQVAAHLWLNVSFNAMYVFQFSFIRVDPITTNMNNATRNEMKREDTKCEREKNKSDNKLQTYGEQVKAIIYISIRTHIRTHTHSYHTHVVTCRRIKYAKCLEYLLICDLFYLYVNVNRKKFVCKFNGRRVCARVSEWVSAWVSERASKLTKDYLYSLYVYLFIFPSHSHSFFLFMTHL